MARHSITIEIDEDRLRGLEDSWLAAYWIAAQVNPAPRHDRQACALVDAIGKEIIRRWVERAPALLYEHTADGYHWEILRRNGHWPGPNHDTWEYVPGKAEEEARREKEIKR